MRLSFSNPTRSFLALGVLAILVLVAVACGDSASSYDSDANPAADFELTLYANAEHQAGDTITLSQFEGQPVVLNFWFPSCPPCVAEMPDFEKAYQKHKDDGLKMIGIQLLGLGYRGRRPEICPGPERQLYAGSRPPGRQFR